MLSVPENVTNGRTDVKTGGANLQHPRKPKQHHPEKQERLLNGGLICCLVAKPRVPLGLGVKSTHVKDRRITGN